MATVRYLIIVVFIFLVSCNSENEGNKNRASSGVSITILIQPFNDMPAELSQYVFTEIKKVYPNVRLLKPIALPVQAFYEARNRYRADSIINWFSRTTKAGFVTIGLTTRDISTTKNEITDWGIMGLGFQPGNACVVSSYRLKKDRLSQELFKVSIHELGHTQGLPHCNVKTCFMRDAEGQNTTDEETGFCPKCRSLMEEKGFRFNH